MTGQVRDSNHPAPANFRAEMERVGLPNVVIARALGVSERQITRWRGGQVPRWGSVVKMAKYFGRRPEWFYVNHSDDDERTAA